MPLVAPENLPIARLLRWERELADRVYLTQPQGGGRVEQWTWARTVDEARRVAAWLRAEGERCRWPAQANIAIISKNCAHWLLSDFAIWLAGYVSVPLYPTLTAHSVRQILEHSEARAIFVGKLDDWPAMAPGIPADCVQIAYPYAPEAAIESAAAKWDEIVRQVAPLREIPERAPGDLATIMYTSGTTGMPKGVMHSFETFGRASEASLALMDLGPDDRMLSYLPLCHAAERWIVEANSIRTGFQVFFVETQDSFAADLKRARPTVFISVPRLWVKFQQAIFARIPRAKLDRLFRIPLLGRVVKKKILRELGLDTVKFAGGGAAPMPASMLNWYREVGLDLYEGYGMTENFGVSHACLPGKTRIGYVGNPYPGYDHRIGPDGEVLVKAPTLMLGYYKEPEKTKETVGADGWLHTGDRGEIDAEGRLRITGRVKELFKTAKGKYVAPAPIENRLVSHPKIEAVCVAGAGHPQPFAIVMLAPDALAASREPAQREALTGSLRELLAQTNAAVDPHERLGFLAVVPDAWNVENGFITPTMKIKRNAVEDAYGRYFDPWAAQRKDVVWHHA